MDPLDQLRPAPFMFPQSNPMQSLLSSENNKPRSNRFMGMRPSQNIEDYRFTQQNPVDGLERLFGNSNDQTPGLVSIAGGAVDEAPEQLPKMYFGKYDQDIANFVRSQQFGSALERLLGR